MSAVASLRDPAEGRAALSKHGSLNKDGSIDNLNSHAGHACCMSRGGRSLIGIRTDLVRVGLGITGDVERVQRGMALPLRCRSWRCECCAVHLRRKARARALMGSTGRIAFATFTIDPWDPRYLGWLVKYPAGPRWEADTAASVRYAAWAWNRFRTGFVRSFGPTPYFRGVELTKNGIAHIHVLFRLDTLSDFFRLRWVLRDEGLAVRAGFGKVVDVQLARHRRDLAGYVTKAAAYVTKATAVPMANGAAVPRLPRYTRRNAWSQGANAWAPGWRKRPVPDPAWTWHVAPCSVQNVRRASAASGLEWLDPATVRANSPGAAGGGIAQWRS